MIGNALAFVVDASDSAAGFLPDESAPGTEAALQATATHDVWLSVLWLLEVGNLMLSAHRCKRITADKRRELARRGFGAAHPDRKPVTISMMDELASRHGLSAYDADYLELALRRGVPSATQNAVLSAAMLKPGVRDASLPR